MSRIVGFVFLLMFFLIGCAQAGTQIPPTATEIPAPTDAHPATDVSLPESTPQAASPTAAAGEPTYRLAYVGQDGNLWIMDRTNGELTQVTADAIPFQIDEPQPEETIIYCCASWSSDGTLLAYQREVGKILPDRMDVQTSIWIYEVSSGTARPVLENLRVNGFAWQPGSHVLAYAKPFDEGYFTIRGSQNTALATGIWGLDADTGANVEMVAPQRGYALVNPNWSANGQFLGFDEVLYMEGRGPFAYYDFAAQQYIAWEDAIGNYSWLQDGDLLAYDRLTYVASGEERIWWRERLGDAETLLSPMEGSLYAFRPVFSPAGDWVAYLVGDITFDIETPNKLFVAQFPSGEIRELGVFSQVFVLSWSPDGSRLVLSVGPHNDQSIIEVSIVDGSIISLAKGSQPAVVTTFP